IRIAQGEPLAFQQADVASRGHAFECRIYAEDPDNDFMPSPGTIVCLQPPAGPGVREDSGVYPGFTVPLDYDPLLSKLIVWGADRDQSAARMRRALDEYQLGGIRHNLGFFRRVFADPEFLAGHIDTGYVARLLARPLPPDPAPAPIAFAAAAIAAAAETPSAAAAAAPFSRWQQEARSGSLRG
ncbi:MAG: acetyl-CoA carboxylase biotin carboxylase subunit, partial [Terriglobales bacterium]